MMHLFSQRGSRGLTLVKRSSTAEQEIQVLHQQVILMQQERDDALRKAAIYKENITTLQRQLEEQKKRSKQELAMLEPSLKKALFQEQIIPLLDELHRTLLYAPKELWSDSWFQGLTLTARAFENLIRQWGVNIYRGKGSIFNAYNFEAVLTEIHPELEEGTIIRVLLPGYWFPSDKQIIRRAQVVVSVKEAD